MAFLGLSFLLCKMETVILSSTLLSFLTSRPRRGDRGISGRLTHGSYVKIVKVRIETEGHNGLQKGVEKVNLFELKGQEFTLYLSQRIYIF